MSMAPPDVPRVIITPSTPLDTGDAAASENADEHHDNNSGDRSHRRSGRARHARLGSFGRYSRRQTLLNALSLSSSPDGYDSSTGSSTSSSSDFTAMVIPSSAGVDFGGSPSYQNQNSSSSPFTSSSSTSYTDKSPLLSPPCHLSPHPHRQSSSSRLDRNRKRKRHHPIAPLIFIAFAFLLVMFSALVPPATIASALETFTQPDSSSTPQSSTLGSMGFSSFPGGRIRLKLGMGLGFRWRKPDLQTFWMGSHAMEPEVEREERERETETEMETVEARRDGKAETGRQAASAGTAEHVDGAISSTDHLVLEEDAWKIFLTRRAQNVGSVSTLEAWDFH